MRALGMAGTVVVVALLGCSQARAQEVEPSAELPPPGYGSLSQDQISVRVEVGDIEIRFLPLDERLLRLVAPDAYESLHGLVASRQGLIDSTAQRAGVTAPGLVLVSFFSLRGEARFDPDNLTFVYRNQVYRPAAFVPLTGSFTGGQLSQRQTASAIFLFEQPLPVFEAFGIVYRTVVSDAWGDVLGRIDRERVRVQSRWKGEKKDTTSSPSP